MGEATSPTQTPRRTSQQIFQWFRADSTRSSLDPRCYVPPPAPQWNHSFHSRDFMFKIAQLVIAVICTGLYSKGALLMQHSITSIMFPNVVFSSFIIITSVITISYVLGHVMPEILIRIFNILGSILYFVSGGITGHFWFVVGQHLGEEGGRHQHHRELYANMLLVQTVLTFINCFLYGADAFLSVKRTLQNLNIDTNK